MDENFPWSFDDAQQTHVWLTPHFSPSPKPLNRQVGACPPRKGTTDEKCAESAAKFAVIHWPLAIDGVIVYDIQDEAGRTTDPRPFPFRPTVDPSGYGKLLAEATGKACVIYKSVGEPSVAAFDEWLDKCEGSHGHTGLNLVGAATSKREIPGPTLADAAGRVGTRPRMAFGGVTIAERHTAKGNEHLNIQRKVDLGAQWFISQCCYDAGATIRLLNDYGDLCKARGTVPKKVVLTFAPCGRRKTMSFIKWLGVSVPAEVEAEILAGAPLDADKPAIKDVQAASRKSVDVCVGLLVAQLGAIISATGSSGVPLGVNVESVSGYMEECSACTTLFHALQHKLLSHTQRTWSIRWVVPMPPAPRVPVAAAADKDGALPLALPTRQPAAVQLLAAAAAGALLVVVGGQLRKR